MITHDITQSFCESAQRIVPGTLVKDDFLSLFEAVGALEIGDVKMDSGSLQPGEALTEKFDTTKPHLPEEVIWIMDQILALQVAWLNGHPLSQTLFTSIHIERILWPEPTTLNEADFDRTAITPNPLPDTNLSLRLYCLLLIKNCDMILRMVTSQVYYEEEDLTTQQFHRELLRRYTPEEVLSYVQNLLPIIDELKSTEAMGHIAVRLEFQSSLFRLLLGHTRSQIKSVGGDAWAAMQAFLCTMQRTAKYGHPVPDSFSTKIQRRLASTMPPRPQVIVEMKNVWPFWREFLHDCQHVFALRCAEDSVSLLEMYHIFAAQYPQLSVYPRALLQTFINIDGEVLGKIGPRSFVMSDVQALTCPASADFDTSSNAVTLPAESRLGFQEFLQLFEQTFLNIFRALSLNSCRIRRNMCHAVMEWDQLQGEAEDIDLSLQRGMHDQSLTSQGTTSHAFALSSWVYHHKLAMMRTIIQLGIEQEVYACHELASVYYYLSRLCDIHLSHLERITFFVSEKRRHAEMQLRGSGKGHPGNEYTTALERLYHEFAVVKAISFLSQSLHRNFVVLQRFGAFKAPSPVYSSDQLRYEIRMKPFLKLSVPEAQSLEDFKVAVEMPDVDTRKLLELATTMSASAQMAWQEVRRRGRIGVQDDQTDTNLAFINECCKKDAERSMRVAVVTAEHSRILQSMIGNEASRVSLSKGARIPGVDDLERLHRRWALPAFPK